MPVLISGLIRRAARIVQDVAAVRWDEPEWLDWFNDGRRELAIARPTEFARRLAVALERGTLQSLPAEAFQLLRVDCNLVSQSPRTPGRAVTQVDHMVINTMHPRWQEGEVFPFEGQAKHYVYNQSEPGTFYVFPGNDGTGTIELSAAVLPNDATAVGEAIGVRDVFANALLDYMLYRAFSKDADHPGNAERATTHYSMFASAVGLRTTTEAQASPNGTAA